MRLTENYEHSFMTGWSELKSRYGSELARYYALKILFGTVVPISTVMSLISEDGSAQLTSV